MNLEGFSIFSPLSSIWFRNTSVSPTHPMPVPEIMASGLWIPALSSTCLETAMLRFTMEFILRDTIGGINGLKSGSLQRTIVPS